MVAMNGSRSCSSRVVQQTGNSIQSSQIIFANINIFSILVPPPVQSPAGVPSVKGMRFCILTEWPSI